MDFKKATVPFMLCLLAFLPIASPAMYLVKPDDEHHVIKNAHSISYYIENSHKYFTSHTELLFLPGLHNLQNDLVLQNVMNFTIHGNGTSVIQCNGLEIMVVAIHITDLTIHNIELMNCS